MLERLPRMRMMITCKNEWKNMEWEIRPLTNKHLKKISKFIARKVFWQNQDPRGCHYVVLHEVLIRDT